MHSSGLSLVQPHRCIQLTTMAGPFESLVVFMLGQRKTIEGKEVAVNGLSSLSAAEMAHSQPFCKHGGFEVKQGTDALAVTVNKDLDSVLDALALIIAQRGGAVYDTGDGLTQGIKVSSVVDSLVVFNISTANMVDQLRSGF